jgi:hypothetical protein
MVYLPKSVASCEQAAPNRKMATRWTNSAITEGIRIADEMLIVEELFWRVSLFEWLLFLHRNISMMIICFGFFEFQRRENIKIVNIIIPIVEFGLVDDGLDRSI